VRSTSVWALVAAEIVSILGTRMTYLALPWFVLVTTGPRVVLTHREDEPAAPVEAVAA
jgi:hypothetical protein